MKKMIMLLPLVLGLTLSGLASSNFAFAASSAEKGAPQAQCPVLSGKIDKSLYADYEGKRIYFCCSSCIDEFKKDPAKYIKKMEDAGITPEKAPASK